MKESIAQLITILIALSLGYYQGYKKRKTKTDKEIERLLEENKDLSKKINEQTQKKNLEQYSNHLLVKGNKDKFMQDLVTLITSNPKIRSEVINSLGFLNCLPNPPIMEISWRQIEKHFYYLEDAKDITVEVQINHVKSKVTLEKSFYSLKKVLNHYLFLERYDLTLQELIDSITYILNQF